MMSRVCRNIKKKLRFGTAEKYLPEETKWVIKLDQPFVDGGKEVKEIKLDYVDLFKGKDLSEAVGKHQQSES